MCDNKETVKNHEAIAPFNNNCLPEFAIIKAKNELNETKENKESGLLELKSRIQDIKELNDIDFHEDFLIQYLRRHKYHVNGAIKQIRNYVVFRRKEEKLFQDISDVYFTDKGVRTFLKVLPFRCPDGCPVVHFRFGEWNSEKLPLEDLKRVAIVMFLQLFRDPMTQINGLKTIYDFKGTSYHQLKTATLSNMYLYYTLAINCFPGRYKAVHMMNQFPVMTAMWVIMKHLLPEKIRKRVIFHSKDEELLNYFPRSMLPADYGGDLQDMDIRDWLRIANKEQKTNDLRGQPNFY